MTLPPPGVYVEPAPGSYTGFPLAVTVSTDPGVKLYYAINEPPKIPPATDFGWSTTLQLPGTARLFVVTETPAGVLHGPYEFEYRMRAPRSSGMCAIAPLQSYYVRGGEQITLSIQYLVPNTLARLELAKNGVWEEVAAESTGRQVAVPIVSLPEGETVFECRVTYGNSTWQGNSLSLYVDATIPSGAWLTPGFAFDQRTWRNQILVSASDEGSGLARIDLCSTPTGSCLPMTPAGDGTYRFSTALTDGTSLMTGIYARIMDNVGNVRTLATESLDFSAYRDPLPPLGSASITLTTDPTIDIVPYIGESPTGLWRVDGAAVTDPASAVDLAPGWNEFLYTVAGSGHFRSFAVYRAGVSVVLPPTAGRWLVFSSNATLPAFQAVLEEEVLPADPAVATEWTRHWFVVPHLFFVEDDGDGQWTGNDLLFHDGAGWSGRWASRGTITEIVPEAVTQPAPALVRTVTVSVAPSMPAGDVFFEWRDGFAAFPTVHMKLPSAFPASVSVPAHGLCVFFIDTHGNGAISADSPRVWDSCTRDNFEIGRSDGSLQVDASPPFWVTGLEFGASVTGEVIVSDAVGSEFLRLPIRHWRDVDGLGRAAALSDMRAIRYPYLSNTVRIYQRGQSVETLTLPLAPLPAGDFEIAVAVTDVSGLPLRAIVSNGHERPQVGTDANGFASVPVWGTAPYYLRAEKEGWLAEKTYASDDTASIRMLSTSVTGEILGIVSDRGLPAAELEITWENAQYYARTYSRHDGSFSLPVSGGDGVLTIARHDADLSRSVEYGYSVTRETRYVEVYAPPPAPELTWPAGLHENTAPFAITGPHPVTLVTGDVFYSALVSGPAEGIWAAEWLTTLRRWFRLPGALPQFPDEIMAWTPVEYAVPPWGIPFVDMSARCGDWEQGISGYVLIPMDCWEWTASDGLQTYLLGRMVDGVFPSQVGMGTLYGSLSDSLGIPIASGKELILEDKVLVGRSLRIRSTDGVIRASVPLGYYDVLTVDGAQVKLLGSPAAILIAPDTFAFFALVLP